MTTATGGEAPLEELMVAMDVVDTIRHRELLVDRELDAEGRRQRLLSRLREIYRAQGIEVTDAALEAGVDALEQERFGHMPTAGGLSATLARIYVRRSRWLKPLTLLLALGLVIWLYWYFSVQLPESRALAALPASIEATHARIRSISESPVATERANELLAQGKRAVTDERFRSAEDVLRQLRALLRDVESSYQIRIVSRPNELSGVWRVPAVNPAARNYYLIVEAIGPAGNAIPLNIRNEEDGRTREVTTWGLRVSEEIFEAVAADKSDDGIIQDYVVGTKQAGKIEPEYRVPTTGATITEW